MKKHFFYYSSLAVILAIGFFMAGILSSDKQLQISFIILTAFFYVVWGVIHHTVHHSFSLKIMLEYIAIAVLSISLVYFVISVAL